MVEKYIVQLIQVGTVVVLAYLAKIIGEILLSVPIEFFPKWGIVVVQLGIVVVGILWMAGKKEL